ncbi:PE/PPE C-terminal domain-containing protein, partial [Mycobacterium kyorinense]|uniref:PE/PPE C-terminal domain-containing protein n=1 Tax=Mycobacterium kyorinense TaxID=487514 RepID=UPI000AD95071
QAAAVAHAAETAAGTSAQPLQSVPATLQALALPTSSSGSPTSGVLGLRPVLSGLLGKAEGSPGWSQSPLGKLLTPSMYSNLLSMGYSELGSFDHMIKVWEDVLPAAAVTKGAEAAASLPGVGGMLGGGPVSAGVSASVGHAGTVGNLSVPQSWAAAAPATNAASAASPLNTISTGPAGRPEGMLRGIPLFPGSGRQSGGDIGQRYGFRHSVMARPLSAG